MTGEIRQYNMPIGKGYPEKGPRKDLGYRAFDFDRLFFGRTFNMMSLLGWPGQFSPAGSHNR